MVAPVGAVLFQGPEGPCSFRVRASHELVKTMAIEDGVEGDRLRLIAVPMNSCNGLATGLDRLEWGFVRCKFCMTRTFLM